MNGPEDALARLQQAPWLKGEDLARLFSALGGNEGRTRFVGGLVRDTLLGRVRQDGDIDLATELEPSEVITRAEAAEIRAIPTGLAHGTVTLLSGQLSAEVTTLREDVETDGRHAVVRFGTDWRRDAERRDFTLNALYADPDGSLFDPLGGLKDCLSARVRFIGEADRRIVEDRLRVFRFFRFSASHGEQAFDAEGLAACQRAAGQLGQLSPERVGAEMLRMLALPRVAKTLETMAGLKILDLHYAAEPQQAYEALAEEPIAAARLALLLKDNDAIGLQGRWRLPNHLVAEAEALLAAANLLIGGQFNDAAYRYPDHLRPAIPVAGALAGWDRARVGPLSARATELLVPPFPISGSDLIRLGLLPGKALGVELNRLEAEWIASAFRLDRTQLLSRVRVP